MFIKTCCYIFVLTEITVSALTLDLNSAIQIALENNKNHRISALEVKVAEAQYQQAMSGRYPQLSAQAGATRQDEPLMFHISGDSVFPDNITQSFALSSASALDEINALGSGGVNSHSNLIATLNTINSGNLPSMSMPFNVNVKAMGRDLYSAQLDVMYPIYTGGKVDTAIKQASLNKILASEKMRQSDDEIIYDVKKYYYSIVLTQKLYNQCSKTFDYFKSVEGLTKTLYEGGSTRVNKTDYLKMTSMMKLFQSIHQELNIQSNLSKSALVYALGLPWDTTIEINGNEFNTNMLSNDDVYRVVEKTSETNSLIRQLEIASKIMDAKINQVHADHLPAVVLTGNVRHIGGDESGYINSENMNSWTIGIGMEWKLFNGFKTTSEEEETRLNRLVLDQKKALLNDGIALQVKSIMMQIKNGIEKEKSLGEALKASSESSKMILDAYSDDMAELKDVIETLLLDFYTFNEYVKGQYQVSMALSELEKLSHQQIDNKHE